jgi:hypothetical protein
MSKMGSHDPFGHLKHKLWPKESLGVKLAIWLLITKSQESPRFPPKQVHATYCWKDLDEGYNFASYLISIRGLHAKLWGLKVAKVPTLEISGLPKCRLDVSLVERHKIYYKGEVGGFPQVQVVVNLVSPRLPMARPSTKSPKIMH